MTAAAPALPDSRALAAWWRQLAPHRPRSLWVGRLNLLRVEAPVSVTCSMHLDRLTLLVLRAMASNPGGATLANLQGRLSVDRPLLAQVLGDLAGSDLAQSGLSGNWLPTARGREALAHGEYPGERPERRSFTFLRADDPAAPPQFLNVRPGVATFWPAGRDWTFDRGLLEDCFRRPADWKHCHDFPIKLRPAEVELSTWHSVAVVYPERLTAVVVIAEAGRRLLGFAVRADGRSLDTDQSAFENGPGWEETFPDLTEPPLAEWRRAWRDWCAGHDIPAAEAETCRLERQDHRLRVAAPRTVTGRLQTRRGESWLLAGHGRCRTAALLDLVAASP